MMTLLLSWKNINTILDSVKAQISASNKKQITITLKENSTSKRLGGTSILSYEISGCPPLCKTP